MRISDWSSDVCSSDLNGPYVERELAFVKVAGHGDQRIEALRLADVYRARVVDATIDSFIFEITGGSEKVDTFINLMRHVGLVEVARTGLVGITRGKEEARVVALALLWRRGMRRLGGLLPSRSWEGDAVCMASPRATSHYTLCYPIGRTTDRGKG